MRVGIYSRYHKHDASYAAIQLAELATGLGCSVSILSASPNRVALDPLWDQHVVKRNDVKFTEWAKKQDIIIWTHCPHMGQLEWVRKEKKRTIIVCLWDELETPDHEILKASGIVAAPHETLAKQLKEGWQLRNAIFTPWDCGIPITKKSTKIQAGRTRLYLPLDDCQPLRCDQGLLDVAGILMATRADLNFVVSYSSSGFQGRALRRVSKLKREFGDRVFIARGWSWQQRLALYNRSDVTLWGARVESFGMVGIASLSMGTPVVAFNYAPINEVLSSDNSIRVPCEVKVSATGSLAAEADYHTYIGAVEALVDSPQSLRSMRSKCNHDLYARRAIFQKAWTQLLR